MVGVGVGEEHGGDVAGAASGVRQVGLQLPEVAGKPGVDQHEAVGALDEEEADHVVAEAVHPGGDLAGGGGVAGGLGHGILRAWGGVPSGCGAGRTAFNTVDCIEFLRECLP